MSDLVEVKNQSQLQAETSALISVIERVALSPEADIAKLEKMLDMQERILDRNAKQAFTASLAEMQVKIPRIAENGIAHNNVKYALLEDINDKLRPILHSHGFAITYRVNHQEKGIHVTTVLSHREGHSEETTIILPADTSGSKNAVQAIGSTISYGKRYGICALLNISTGDDRDGAGLGGQSEKLLDWLAALDQCTTLQDLQSTYQTAFRELKGDNAALQSLNAKKDQMKKELSK